jgi:hypothetical protein
MAALENAAYDDLRAERVVDWEMEIQETGGTPVLRVDSSDPRLTVSDNAGNDTTSFVLVLSGDDAEITVPTSVDKSRLFNPAGTAMTAVESFSEFTFATTDDQLTVTHTVILPAP